MDNLNHNLSRRSSTVCWLLAAATVAVTAVATRWLSLVDEKSLTAYLFEALVVGELAVVCLWSVFSAQRALGSWIGVVVGVFAATLLAFYATRLSLAEAGGVYGVFAAALVAVLWILKRTRFWQRISGTDQTGWQFSMAHLLAVMTLVALLVPLVNSSPFLSSASQVWKFFVVMTAGDVILATGTTIIWAWSRQRAWLPFWLPRYGAICWFAIPVGVAEAAIARSGILGRDVTSVVGQRVGSEFVAYTMILSLVIFVWLELAPIVPVASRSSPPRSNDDEQSLPDEA
jgi:hypothetical protein